MLLNSAHHGLSGSLFSECYQKRIIKKIAYALGLPLARRTGHPKICCFPSRSPLKNLICAPVSGTIPGWKPWEYGCRVRSIAPQLGRGGAAQPRRQSGRQSAQHRHHHARLDRLGSRLCRCQTVAPGRYGLANLSHLDSRIAIRFNVCGQQ